MAIKGPGDADYFDAATWRYEGGRVSLRDFRTGGQHILNLRCPVNSGRWEHAWAAYLDRAA